MSIYSLFYQLLQDLFLYSFSNFMSFSFTH